MTISFKYTYINDIVDLMEFIWRRGGWKKRRERKRGTTEEEEKRGTEIRY